jgi:hypothetical protein
MYRRPRLEQRLGIFRAFGITENTVDSQSGMWWWCCIERDESLCFRPNALLEILAHMIDGEGESMTADNYRVLPNSKGAAHIMAGHAHLYHVT